MKLDRLIKRINRYFPPKSSEPWDFPGYQCGIRDKDKEINKVLLCLDFTEDCLPILDKEKPDLILTHHPFYFGKKKDVLLHDGKKYYLEEKVKELGISLYSYHTDFDSGKGGMNDTLLNLLKFNKNGEEYSIKDIAFCPDGLMRIATLPYDMEFDEVIGGLKSSFDLDNVRYLKGNDRRINKIGFVAGGGASMYIEAFENGADLYISGDCAHHTRLDMKRYGINYIDIPHEVEEIGFLKGMKKTLLDIDLELDVIPFAYEKYFDQK